MSENNVSSFLKRVKDLKKDSVEIYVPSRKKTFDFTPLTLKQQKDIITCVADGIAGLIGFTRTANNIIESNGGEGFKVYDRTPIIVALRANALGVKYKKDNKEVSLEDVLDKIKNDKETYNDTLDVEYSDIKVKVEVPTLQEENVIVKKLEEEIKRNGENNNTKNLGSIYVYEIIKYIKSIEHGDTILDFTSLKISERIEIIEALPLALNRKIIAFIEKYKRIERELLTVDDVVVEIDPGFFDVD